MKNQRGITLVSLVVTIIILIILAGISINMLLGENGIITKAQEAKENIVLAQEGELKNLNELYSQLDNIGNSTGNTGDIDSEAVQKLIEFKRAIATAITNEGVNTLETDSLETMVGNIGKILQERTKDATATAEDILEGKTAWVNGQKITGQKSVELDFTGSTIVKSYSNTSAGTFSSSYTFQKNGMFIGMGSGSSSTSASCSGTSNFLVQGFSFNTSSTIIFGFACEGDEVTVRTVSGGSGASRIDGNIHVFIEFNN